jgi:hypothetical protein
MGYLKAACTLLIEVQAAFCVLTSLKLRFSSAEIRFAHFQVAFQTPYQAT